MVYGRQNLMEWFCMQGKPYFSIFRKSESQSGNFVFTNKDKENETTETAKSFLDQCLKILGSGDFFIYCGSTADKTSTKGRSETFFNISLNEQTPQVMQQQPPQMAGIGAITEDQVNAMADKRFADLMQKKELEDLKKKTSMLERENRALQTKASEPMNGFLKGLQPYIGNIVEALGVKKMATPLPISGVNHDEKPDDNTTADEPAENDQEAAQLAVSQFLEALANLYPDTWKEVLEKLTNTIVNDPDKIEMAIKFL